MSEIDPLAVVARGSDRLPSYPWIPLNIALEYAATGWAFDRSEGSIRDREVATEAKAKWSERDKTPLVSPQPNRPGFLLAHQSENEFSDDNPALKDFQAKLNRAAQAGMLKFQAVAYGNPENAVEEISSNYFAKQRLFSSIIEDKRWIDVIVGDTRLYDWFNVVVHRASYVKFLGEVLPKAEVEPAGSNPLQSYEAPDPKPTRRPPSKTQVEQAVQNAIDEDGQKLRPLNQLEIVIKQQLPGASREQIRSARRQLAPNASRRGPRGPRGRTKPPAK